MAISYQLAPQDQSVNALYEFSTSNFLLAFGAKRSWGRTDVNVVQKFVPGIEDFQWIL